MHSHAHAWRDIPETRVEQVNVGIICVCARVHIACLAHVYTCMYVCTYAVDMHRGYEYVWIHAYVDVLLHVCVCAHVCTYLNECVCMYACLCVSVYISPWDRVCAVN
jgi:hypothetical protein